MNYVLTILVIVANVLGAGMIMPQLLRLRGSAVSEGVSAVGIGVGIVQNLWWITYGLQADGGFSIVPVSTVGAVLYTAIAVRLIQMNGSAVVGSIAGGFAGIGLIPLVPYLLVSLHAAGLTIGVLYGVQFAPAAVAAIRTRHPVGISFPTWSMAFVEAMIWLGYGLHVGDSALALGGAGGSLMAGVIVLRLAAVRTQMRPRLAV